MGDEGGQKDGKLGDMGKEPLHLEVCLNLPAAESQKLQHSVTLTGKVADREYPLSIEIEQITLMA